MSQTRGKIGKVVILTLAMLIVGTTTYALEIEWLNQEQIAQLRSETSEMMSNHKLTMHDAFKLKDGSARIGVIVGSSVDTDDELDGATLAWLSEDRKNLFIGVMLGVKRSLNANDMTATAVETVYKRENRTWVISHPFKVAQQIFDAYFTEIAEKQLPSYDPVFVRKLKKEIEETTGQKVSNDLSDIPTKAEMKEMWRVTSAEDLWQKWQILAPTNAILFPIVPNVDSHKVMHIYYSPGCSACKHVKELIADTEVQDWLIKNSIQLYWWPIGSDNSTINQAARSIEQEDIFVDAVSTKDPSHSYVMRVAENFMIYQQLMPEAVVPITFWADKDNNLQHKKGAWETKEEFIEWLSNPVGDTEETDTALD